ncbi:MAG: hypothetical protein KatS3mg087_0099 [Patescibacteria group bacterium]|nr:MAG: hypothetical protein KatS3mg087_0099 [Patescibacteria group bacterium]
MALVAYLDWEVRTTGHDLNCSGFNPNRDPTNGVDYTQQDNAEIISLNWTVDATNNTWIRSTDLTNWVNSGKVLASLKGNHIHIAGKAIGGNTLFQWVASTAVPGAYYLQALGGGNPNWPTKPTRFWMNKVFVLENTALPSGSNSWTYGDKDSLGYSTIYVRFGAENDADPNTKAQDDIIADGQTWTRGAYEIVNVGTDGNGPYLVLDRSPGAAGSVNGYGRIGGAMYSPGGIGSLDTSVVKHIHVLQGSYTYRALMNCPSGLLVGSSAGVIGYSSETGKFRKPSAFPEIYLIGADYSGDASSRLVAYTWFKIIKNSLPTATIAYYHLFIECEFYSPAFDALQFRGSAMRCYFYGCHLYDVGHIYCYYKQCRHAGATQIYSFCVIDSPRIAQLGIYYTDRMYNTVIYNASSGIVDVGWSLYKYYDSIVFVNVSTAVSGSLHKKLLRRMYIYNVTIPIASNTNCVLMDGSPIVLPGNPFRDPDNGDFRLADNEAGRMLKQAGFQIPGPQGAPPMKFDVGAVQNSFYDVASGGAVINRPMLFGT